MWAVRIIYIYIYRSWACDLYYFSITRFAVTTFMCVFFCFSRSGKHTNKVAMSRFCFVNILEQLWQHGQQFTSPLLTSFSMSQIRCICLVCSEQHSKFDSVQRHLDDRKCLDFWKLASDFENFVIFDVRNFGIFFRDFVIRMHSFQFRVNLHVHDPEFLELYCINQPCLRLFRLFRLFRFS